MHSNFRPGLTKAELQALSAQYRGHADVTTLLWEIARLRVQRLRDFQLRSLWRVGGGPLRMIAATHIAELLAEPCVVEQETILLTPEAFAARTAAELTAWDLPAADVAAIAEEVLQYGRASRHSPPHVSV
ncbi:hypothetical protein JOE11_005488 [Robbsia andropogonis]|uniref:hypothetical protein n=1 Tax=Robbsia andropogonis TaxID=28092 RepID=UPI003D1D8DBA